MGASKRGYKRYLDHWVRETAQKVIIRYQIFVTEGKTRSERETSKYSITMTGAIKNHRPQR